MSNLQVGMPSLRDKHAKRAWRLPRVTWNVSLGGLEADMVSKILHFITRTCYIFKVYKDNIAPEWPKLIRMRGIHTQY